MLQSLSFSLHSFQFKTLSLSLSPPFFFSLCSFISIQNTLSLSSFSFSLSTSERTQSFATPSMAERQPGPGPVTRPSATRGGGGGGCGSPTGATFLRRFHGHAPTSAQLVGFLTLVISGGILLILTGLTLTATVLALIFFTPLVLLSSPIWVPAGTVIFIAIAGFLSMCALGVASLAGLSWVYKYMRGWHPPGSDRVDYARSRIACTASHVKDYAREYGGYLHSKVKDAAPGA